MDRRRKLLFCDVFVQKWGIAMLLYVIIMFLLSIIFWLLYRMRQMNKHLLEAQEELQKSAQIVEDISKVINKLTISLETRNEECVK